VGFKPAGGIRAAKDAISWLAIMKEELGKRPLCQAGCGCDPRKSNGAFAVRVVLGDEWTHPDLFRLGASTLLTDIERQLYHNAFKRYAAAHQLAMS
jgi:deoxyribose-phosphate aldolase